MIEYKIRKGPTNRHNNTQYVYAYPKSRGKISTAILCKDISGASTFTAGDIKGVIYALAERIEHYLKDGYSVEINELGIFSVTLSLPKGTDDSTKVGLKDVKFGSIKFRTAKELKSSMKQVRLTRKTPKTVELKATEQRLDNILNLAQTQDFITIADCIKLNHCTRYRATADLTTLVKDRKLKIKFVGGQKLFLKINDE